MPPTTIIANTKAATANSQLAIALGRARGRGAAASVAIAAHMGPRIFLRNFSADVMLYLHCRRIIEAAPREAVKKTMFANAARNGTMDRVGIALSGLCLVHCLASAIFVAMLASAGGLLLDPIIHEVGLVLAILLGSLALGRGILHHGFMMPSAVGGLGLGVMSGSMMLEHGGSSTIYTVIGVMILALGHDLNRRAVI
jgi:hypothetical protein